MNVSLDWIKTWLPLGNGTPIDVQTLADILTASGLEVEGVEEIPAVPGGLKGMVVGEVKTCIQHPNADRLRVTTVDVGSGDPLHIVCGAPNVASGQKVIVATVGAVCHPLKGDPFKIKKGKIRGEVSEGMICAVDELGIGEDHDGILVLPDGVPVGMAASEALGVTSDHRIEIGLTPNRTDAMSHIGVARDLRAAMLWNGGRETADEVPELGALPAALLSVGPGPIQVNVEDADGAPCYLGVTLRDVKVGPSPEWMQQRLRAIGLEPRNNVVDVTNYVLHDLGQPLHAFDADKIEGGVVMVRRAKAGEPFVTLDGKALELDLSDLVIADQRNPMCLAGVYGGEVTGVQESTTSVFLESAWFEPVSIRKSAKRHTLSTDASFRFERGVDPAMTRCGLEKAVALLQEFAGARVDGGVQEYIGHMPGPHNVDLAWQRLDEMVGVQLDRSRVKGILKALDIDILTETPDTLSLEVPGYRRDVTRPADVVEEILRIYGYDHVPLPGRMKVSLSPKADPDPEALRNALSFMLVARGFREVMHNSLVPSAHLTLAEDQSLDADRGVRLLNPLSSELDAMRQSLLPQHLETVGRNRNYQQADLALFEFGKTYFEDAEGGHTETEFLSLTLTGRMMPESWRASDQDGMSLMKGAVEVILERSGVVGWGCSALSGGDFFKEGIRWTAAHALEARGGLVHPNVAKSFGVDVDVFHAELPFSALLEWSGKRRIQAQALPKFPSVRRDLSLWVPQGVDYSSMEQVVRQTAGKLLKDIRLFDVYHDAERDVTSYAIALTLQDPDKTLGEKAIEKTVHRVCEQLSQRLDVSLR